MNEIKHKKPIYQYEDKSEDNTITEDEESYTEPHTLTQKINNSKSTKKIKKLHRIRNAIDYFAKEYRSKIKKELAIINNNEEKVSEFDLYKEIQKQFNALPQNLKKKYFDLKSKDAERFRKERAKLNGPKKAFHPYHFFRIEWKSKIISSIKAKNEIKMIKMEKIEIEEETKKELKIKYDSLSDQEFKIYKILWTQFY